MEEGKIAKDSFPRRLVGWCVVGSGIVAAASAFILMAHIVLNTAMRYLTDTQILGTIEITSNWWMVLLAFPVFALAQRKREHIDVIFVTDMLPEVHRHISYLLMRLLAIGIVLMMTIYGWHHALKMAALGEYALGAVRVPIWPMRFVVPFGMGLFALQMIVDLVDDFLALKACYKGGSNDAH